MLITKTSPISGKQHTMDIPVTQQQIDAWERGELIHKAMPEVPAELREFILSGITPEEWNDLFGRIGEEEEA
jgi:hypothetical protein